MMRRFLRPLAIGSLLFVSVVVTPVSAQTGQFDLTKTRTVLTGLIEKAMKENGVPSISIALVRGDSIVWKAAFGYANVRMKTPATTETYYSTGSTFKAATATAIMQLVEQGKLTLDAPVNRFLGDVQIQDRLQAEKPVTFRHILSHWSGLTAGAVTKPIWGRELPKSLEAMVGTLYSVRPPETILPQALAEFRRAGPFGPPSARRAQDSFLAFRTWRPLYIPVFKSRWCGRRNSPESLSSA